MASEAVQEFNEGNFQEEVLGSDQPVLVDFWAQWCPPCRALAPTVDEVADEYQGRVKVGKVDTDSNQTLAVTYKITGIPTLLIFKGGEIVGKIQGAVRKREIAEELDKHIEAAATA